MRLPEEEVMVREILLKLLEDTQEARLDFINSSDSELYLYHHTLGRAIRNDYGLWEVPHNEYIVDGIDVSPTHPDAISMRVIKETHRRANADREKYS